MGYFKLLRASIVRAIFSIGIYCYGISWRGIFYYGNLCAVTCFPQFEMVQKLQVEFCKLVFIHNWEKTETIKYYAVLFFSQYIKRFILASTDKERKDCQTIARKFY